MVKVGLTVSIPPPEGDKDFTLDLSSTKWNQLVGNGNPYNYSHPGAPTPTTGTGGDFETFVGGLSPLR